MDQIIRNIYLKLLAVNVLVIPNYTDGMINLNINDNECKISEIPSSVFWNYIVNNQHWLDNASSVKCGYNNSDSSQQMELHQAAAAGVTLDSYLASPSATSAEVRNDTE